MEFRHPKYYKELRKRNKLAESRQPVVGGQQQSDQVISLSPHDGVVERAPGPGLKQQATSVKLQAPSSASIKPQASSPKQQASSFKPQASSSMIREPRNI